MEGLPVETVTTDEKCTIRRFVLLLSGDVDHYNVFRDKAIKYFPKYILEIGMYGSVNNRHGKSTQPLREISTRDLPGR
jgi:hypothetical protein